MRGVGTIWVAPTPRRSVPHFGQKFTGPAEVSARYPHLAHGGWATWGAARSAIRTKGIRNGAAAIAPLTGGALDVVSLRRARLAPQHDLPRSRDRSRDRQHAHLHSRPGDRVERALGRRRAAGRARHEEGPR